MRLAVVSPFLDRQHGTERCIVEQLERLSRDHGWEVHLYSQSVRDLETIRPGEKRPASSPKPITWHRVTDIPGPHLLKYLWWFFANGIRRWRDAHKTGLRPDVTYSPGINCMNADAIVVHIVFHEFYGQVREELALRRLPIGSWPWTLHRKIYYRLIMQLERTIYPRPEVKLAAVSGLVAAQMKKHFGRSDVVIIPNGVDATRFSPETRKGRREGARGALGYKDGDFVLLLIGNDWKKKGLDTLISSLKLLQAPRYKALVVGRDEPAIYQEILAKVGLLGSVRFHAASEDVLQFYAAADAYAGPSLEDAFNLPILEAMACGLPVIASIQAGASENVRHGENGFVLQNPRDAKELGELIESLYRNAPLREKMGNAAAVTAKNCSWDRNAEQTHNFLAALIAKSAED